MRTVSNVRLKQLDGMSLQEIIDFVSECGYGTESLGNDEIYDLAIEIIDGHGSEDAFEELDFSDD